MVLVLVAESDSSDKKHPLKHIGKTFHQQLKNRNKNYSILKNKKNHVSK